MRPACAVVGTCLVVLSGVLSGCAGAQRLPHSLTDQRAPAIRWTYSPAPRVGVVSAQTWFLSGGFSYGLGWILPPVRALPGRGINLTTGTNGTIVLNEVARYGTTIPELRQTALRLPDGSVTKAEPTGETGRILRFSAPQWVMLRNDLAIESRRDPVAGTVVVRDGASGVAEYPLVAGWAPKLGVLLDLPDESVVVLLVDMTEGSVVLCVDLAKLPELHYGADGTPLAPWRAHRGPHGFRVSARQLRPIREPREE